MRKSIKQRKTGKLPANENDILTTCQFYLQTFVLREYMKIFINL